MRILIRTSKWAIWARRIASLALPLVVVPVFLHRDRLITSADFATVEIVALAVTLLALLLSLGAFARLWVTGDRGWGNATMGVLLSMICLAPFAAVGYFMLRYPSTADITTTPADPPEIVSQRPAHAALDWTAVEESFPNAQERTYPIEAAQMVDIVAGLVTQFGWEPRARRTPQTSLGEGQINAIATTSGEYGEGQINAIATTQLGWREEAAIRIRGVQQGSIVSMRSVALHPGHDLGENGRRIERFLAALDAQVTLLLRETPVASAPLEEEAAPPIESEDDDP